MWTCYASRYVSFPHNISIRSTLVDRSNHLLLVWSSSPVNDNQWRTASDLPSLVNIESGPLERAWGRFEKGPILEPWNQLFNLPVIKSRRGTGFDHLFLQCRRRAFVSGWSTGTTAKIHSFDPSPPLVQRFAKVFTQLGLNYNLIQLNFFIVPTSARGFVWLPYHNTGRLLANF